MRSVLDWEGMQAMAKLTARRRKVIEEDVKDWNGAPAAIRAGYSKKTARVIASELLTFPNVQAEIKKHLPDSDEITCLIAEIARAKAEEATRDRLKALELLGKTHSLFTDKIEHRESGLL